MDYTLSKSVVKCIIISADYIQLKMCQNLCKFTFMIQKLVAFYLSCSAHLGGPRVGPHTYINSS